MRHNEEMTSDDVIYMFYILWSTYLAGEYISPQLEQIGRVGF